jgi:hypothetical protein
VAIRKAAGHGFSPEFPKNNWRCVVSQRLSMSPAIFMVMRSCLNPCSQIL